MPRSGALATRSSEDALRQLEKVVIQGDLAALTPAERVAYYARVCESLGLNPLTRPFEYLNLGGRLVLYARKDAGDQLRKINGISVDEVTHERDDTLGLAIVTVKGHDRGGRTDAAIGAVSIAGLKGEALANALMKADTKAHRRFTLSLAGLGWLDETEIDDGPVERAVVATRAEVVRARAKALTDQAGAEQAAVEEPTAANAEPPPPNEPGPDSDGSSGDIWMRRIHALGAERGLDHEALHDLAAHRHAVGSLTELSVIQRAQLEREVERMPLVADTGPSEGATGEAADFPPAASIPSSAETGEQADGPPVPPEPEPATTPPPPATSVATPTSREAFTIFAAAALGIPELEGWDLDELTTADLDDVIEKLVVEDYDAWWKSLSRDLRATLMNAKMSPRQRRDRAAAKQAEAALAAAATGGSA